MQIETSQSLFTKISDCNQSIKENEVEKILVLYDERVFYLGDSCLKFDRIRTLKSFFKNASIDINWRNAEYSDVYTSMLINNPTVNKATNLDWQEIDFLAYDVIICITIYENQLLQLLENKYRHVIFNDLWRTAIFSLSAQILHPGDNSGKNDLSILSSFTFFPLPQKFIVYATPYKPEPHVYISSEEKEWGNNWLRENGLQENEQLFIIVDSSANSSKLLNQEVYAEVLKYLLRNENTKLLIFDEKNAGKESFYEELLGKENIPSFIFAKGLTLRKEMCILSSDYVKLIMGPCTGLLHCASGIYNEFVAHGMPPAKVPVMLVYAGKTTITPEWWWGGSPLINCLILRQAGDTKEAVLRADLNEYESAEMAGLLLCKEFTTTMITDFLSSRSL